MRATVFTDPALARHAGRFVWLSIDTENERNAAFLEKYPWKAVPTFQVIDPRTGDVVYHWLGAVDANALAKRFDEAEFALTQTRPDGAPRLPSSADAEVLALAMAGKNDECLAAASARWEALPPGGEKAGVAAIGLDCALSSKSPEATTFEARVKDATGYPGLLDDDRSSLFGALVDARDRQEDEAGGKAAAIAWLDYLDAQAKSAPGAEARAALDGHRVSAAIRAGDPARMIPALEASVRDLPEDYNPPARLALLLREAGRLDEALAASDRALAKAYGPRKLNLLDARATILEKKGDPDGAKAVLRQALEFAQTLPEPQRPKGMIARIEKRLAG